MKWLSVFLEVAVIIYNHVTGKGKRDLAQELEIAQGALKIATSSMDKESKARLILDVVGNLKVAKKFKKRISKKLDKARDRLAKKFF